MATATLPPEEDQRTGEDSYVNQGIDDAQSFLDDQAGGSSDDSDDSPETNAIGAAAAKPLPVKLSGGSSLLKNRRNGVIIGAVASILVTLTVSFFLLLPLKIIHIAENLFNHNGATVSRTDKKLAAKLAAKLSPFDKKSISKLKGNRGFFGSDYSKQSLGDLESALESEGVKVTPTTDGTGIKTIETGGATEDFTSKTASTAFSKLGDLTANVLNLSAVGERVKLLPEMALRYRISFRGLKPDGYKNESDFLADEDTKITDGATSAELNLENEAAAQDKLATDPNATPTDKANAPTEAKADRATNDLVKAADDNFNTTHSTTDAVKVAQEEFTDDSKPIGLVGGIQMICSIDKIGQETITSGYASRAIQLMREGGDIMAIASQLRTGHITLAALGDTAKLFEGDPSAVVKDSTGKVTASEGSLDFTQSAGWHRATGQPVGKNNPDLNKAAYPNASNGLASILNFLNNVIDKFPLGKQVCSVSNSKFGFFGAFIAQGFELAANFTDAGIEETAATVADTALKFEIAAKVIPPLISGAAGLAITGTEDAVQQVNNRDAGLSLMMSDYSRSTGGRPLSNAEHKQLVLAADADQAAADQKMGLAYNVFSTNNPNSALSRLIDVTPSSPQLAFIDLADALTNIPHVLATIGGGLISPANADTTTDDNPYDFRQYGFTDAEINKYDDIQTDIINYFEQVDPASGKNRLDALGDPAAFTAGQTDPNKGDLLHCFINPFLNESDAADPNCGAIGYITNSTTGTGGPAPTSSLPTDATINNIYKAFCASNNMSPCPFQADDELLRYRLYLGYENVGSEMVDRITVTP